MKSLRYPTLPSLLGDVVGLLAWTAVRGLSMLPATWLVVVARTIAGASSVRPDSLLHRSSEDVVAILTSRFGPILIRRLGRARPEEIRDIVRGALMRPWA